MTTDCLKVRLDLRTQGAMQKRRGKSQRVWKTPRKGPLSNTTRLMHLWAHRACESTHRNCTYEPTETVKARTGSAQVQARWGHSMTKSREVDAEYLTLSICS